MERDALLGRAGRSRLGGDSSDPHRRTVIRGTTLGAVVLLCASAAYIVKCPCFREPKLGRGYATPTMALFTDEVVSGSRAWRVHVMAPPVGDSSSGRRLSWADVLAKLSTDRAFTLAWSKKLASAPYRAFFWETPAVTHKTSASIPFEFVTIPAEHLEGIEPDALPFQQYIGGDQRGLGGAVSFLSLGGDSTLVSPTADLQAVRTGEQTKYAHIAAFVRGASDEQAVVFWQTVARTLNKVLDARGDEPTWVSTEGSGVSWLHVRLDSRPKYFHWAPYKQPPPSK